MTKKAKKTLFIGLLLASASFISCSNSENPMKESHYNNELNNTEISANEPILVTYGELTKEQKDSIKTVIEEQAQSAASGALQRVVQPTFYRGGNKAVAIDVSTGCQSGAGYNPPSWQNAFLQVKYYISEKNLDNGASSNEYFSRTYSLPSLPDCQVVTLWYFESFPATNDRYAPLYEYVSMTNSLMVHTVGNLSTQDRTNDPFYLTSVNLSFYNDESQGWSHSPDGWNNAGFSVNEWVGDDENYIGGYNSYGETIYRSRSYYSGSIRYAINVAQ